MIADAKRFEPSRPFVEGNKAGFLGLDRISNPYVRLSDNWAHWELGYLSGLRDADDEIALKRAAFAKGWTLW